MLLGFGEIIPRHALKDFTATELKALVNGKDTIDAATLRAGVKYSGTFMDTDPIVRFKIWKKFEQIEKCNCVTLYIPVVIIVKMIFLTWFFF